MVCEHVDNTDTVTAESYENTDVRTGFHQVEYPTLSFHLDPRMCSLLPATKWELPSSVKQRQPAGLNRKDMMR